MRVYELSRELGLTNNQIKIAAGKLDTPITHHMYDLEPEFEAQLREYFDSADGSETEPEPKKKPTRPWDADSNPWSQHLLATKEVHKGYHPRFIRRENLQKWIDRGYKLADAKDYGGVDEVIPGEEAKDGSLVKRRELILVECTLENKKKHDEYIDWKSNERMRAAVESAESKVKGIEKEGKSGGVHFETEFTSKRGQ
jgi:hypothetical protein